MAGILAGPGLSSSNEQVRAVLPLREGHDQQTFGHVRSPQPFPDVCEEAAEEQRYLQGQDEGHSDGRVNGDVNVDGDASRGAAYVGNNNAGPVGTCRVAAYFMPTPYGCLAPRYSVPNGGWMGPFRARGVAIRGTSFRGGFRPFFGGPGQRPPISGCGPPMAPWEVQSQPGTQWRTPFRPRFRAPTQRPFIPGAAGRGALNGFGNRPSLPSRACGPLGRLGAKPVDRRQKRRAMCSTPDNAKRRRLFDGKRARQV
ncbi:hypothetical protein MRX96_042433 [Rhipicephalus microplus]